MSYTKPELRERIKSRVMSGSDGGKPGQWSARKAQLVAQKYEAAGGGYKGGKTESQKSLSKWTDQKWTTSDGKPAERKGGTTRYLPEKAWDKLSPGERAATNAKKREGSRKGEQFVQNTEAAAEARKEASYKSAVSQQWIQRRVQSAVEGGNLKQDSINRFVNQQHAGMDRALAKMGPGQAGSAAAATNAGKRGVAATTAVTTLPKATVPGPVAAPHPPTPKPGGFKPGALGKGALIAGGLAAGGYLLNKAFGNKQASLIEDMMHPLLAKIASESGAWQRSEGKNPEGGLNAKGRASLKAQGHDIKPGVKGKADTPEKMRRKGSFLSRMFRPGASGPMKKPNGEPTRRALSAKAWGEPVPQDDAGRARLYAKGQALLKKYKNTKEAAFKEVLARYKLSDLKQADIDKIVRGSILELKSPDHQSPAEDASIEQRLHRVFDSADAKGPSAGTESAQGTLPASGIADV
jgi:hypothetical protein